MTLAMELRTISLLIVLIVYCVNQCSGFEGGSWSKTYSSSSASSSASSYSSSKTFSSGGPIDVSQINLVPATAFATANAQAGVAGASAKAGATAGASAGGISGSFANAGSQAKNGYLIDSGTQANGGSLASAGSLSNAGALATGGSQENSDSHASGTADFQNTHESGAGSSSDGAIVTNVIAGAYHPGYAKPSPVTPAAGSKSTYYSHDFILPQKETDSDYDNSEEGHSKADSHATSKSSTSTTYGGTTAGKTSLSPTVPVPSINLVSPESTPNLSGSITANTHLKTPTSATPVHLFPGSSGSIHDYKPAPPGGGGPDKAWIVTPVSGVGSYAQANAGASSHADSLGLTYHLVNSLPGAHGSIFDGKPATGSGCSGSSCTSSGTYQSPSTGSAQDSKIPEVAVLTTGPTYSPGSGCSGTSCSSSGSYKPNLSLPGAPGSIHDSKPVPGAVAPSIPTYNPSVSCSGPACSSSGSSGSTIVPTYNPGVSCSGAGCSSSAATGSVSSSSSNGCSSCSTGNQPSYTSGTGCSFGSGCNTQPSSTNIGSSGINSIVLPGPSGSIYDSKPVSQGIAASTAANSGANAQNTATVTQGTYHTNQPGSGCSYGSGCSTQPSSTNIGSSGINSIVLPGPSGSIYDSKPVSQGIAASTAANAGANAQNTAVTQGTYHTNQPSYSSGSGCSAGSSCGTQSSSTSGISGINSVVLPGPTGSIYDSKPIAGSTAHGNANAQSTASVNQGTYQSHPSFPGSSGSIYDSKPISGSSLNTQTSSPYQPVQSISLPGLSGGIDYSKPAVVVGTTPVVAQSSESISPGLSHIIPTFPGQPGSIYNSKPVGAGVSTANANAVSTGTGSVLCTGSSCGNSVPKPSYSGSGCSGSSCGSRPSYSPGYISVPLIPVSIVPEGSYHKRPAGGCSGPICGVKPFGSGCSGPSCGGYAGIKPVLETMLLPPISSSKPTYSSGCTGLSCAGGSVPTSGTGSSSPDTGCTGSSCTNGGVVGQITVAGANAASNAQSSAGGESGKYPDSGSGLYTSKLSGPCASGSGGCSKSVANNKVNSNGVISGPGTGALPVDESTSGSYLGLKIPGDTAVKPIVEEVDESKPSGCAGGSCGTFTDAGQAQTVTGTGTNSEVKDSSASVSGSETGSYGPSSSSGCASGSCGSGSAGVNSLQGTGNADGFATGSVYIQGQDGLVFPGPDNSKLYGTEKPGIACHSGGCGSQNIGTAGAGALSDVQSGGGSSGCSSGSCGSSNYNSAGGVTAGTGGAFSQTGSYGGGIKGASYSAGCASGNCGSNNLGSYSGTSGAGAFSSAQSGSGSVSGGYDGAFGKTGSLSGHKGLSGSYSSGGSVSGSGVDLGPLSHFFGAKGGASANAGSFSSSGSFAKSGSFASSFSSASAGSY